MRRPLPPVAVGLAVGIWLAATFGFWSLPCTVLLCLLLGLGRRTRSALPAGCALSLGAAWLLLALSVWPAAYGPAESLMLVQAVSSKANGATLTVSLKSLAGRPLPVWNRVRGSIYLAGGTDFLPGDLLSGTVDWRRPTAPQNPGEFDFARYQARQGILATAYLDRGQSLKQVRVAGSPRNLGQRLRQSLLERALTLPEPAGELLSTLLLGASPGEWAATWRQAGLAHVLAVSGLHVGLLIGMLLRLLTRLAVPPRWRQLLGALALLGYGLLVGPRPSVWRAIVMALIGLAALATGRLRDWQSALSAAAILLLLSNPQLLFDAGWQLSFAATFGVLALSPLIASRLPLLPRQLERAIAVSLAAQAATLPLGLSYFYLFTPLAIVSNLLLLPFLPLLLLLGAVYLAFFPLTAMLAPAVGGVLRLVQSAVDRLAGLPGMSISLGQPPTWLVAIAMLLLVLFWQSRPERRRQLAAGWLLALLLSLGWQPLWRFTLQRYQLRVLAVGQGASSVLHLPDSRALLFDVGGGQKSVGERIIVPYLRQQGTLRVAAIYLSHLDQDHVAGLADVLAAFPVDCIYISPLAVGQAWYSELTALASDQQVPLVGLRAGQHLTVGALRVDVLHPTKSVPSERANEDSLVLSLAWPNLRVLLPGDIGQETEVGLISAVRLPLDVLLVAHHGSGNSSDQQFLSALNPTYSVISTGPNQYGHPALSTLTRLERYSQRVLRTDQAGAVLFWTDLRRRGFDTFCKINR